MSADALQPAQFDNVVRVDFGTGNACPSCHGWGRIKGDPHPHPDFPFATVTPTHRCADCGGLGTRMSRER